MCPLPRFAMKISPMSNVHLTYCTNIHPGESWREVFDNLQQYLPVLKARLSPDAPFGIGLRLAAIAAQELLVGETLDRFQAWLKERDLYVFTLNGFPYGGFHRQVVKDRVYAPDWSQPSRVDYTLQLADILARLLPSPMDGSISTVPLSYKPWWKTESDRESVLQGCCLNLARVAAHLVRIREETGKSLHVDLEPEPDGGLENAAEAIAFFKTHLLPKGSSYLARELGISRASGEELLRDCIQICYDTCHFAVEYEEPAESLTRLHEAGMGIGKVQLSTAVQVKLPEDLRQRDAIAERLSPFAETTY
ncbi:MAG: metabolite traffic protein EboE, partial [Spirulina sp.]